MYIAQIYVLHGRYSCNTANMYSVTKGCKTGDETKGRGNGEQMEKCD